MSPTPGTLWIVATPIGNPEDLSPRARAVLGSVDMVLAEDTRRSGQLLASCGVEARRFISLHDHNEKNRLAGVIARLEDGASAALVSDAGTPLMSDPGYLLVNACRERGLPVSPVPGPSAPLAALSASGLPPVPFVFLGFPPRSAGDIRKFFAPYAALEATLAFFERKDRLAGTLGVAHGVLGERRGCVARELTKTFEEFIPFTLGPDTETAFTERELLGEITVILGPPLVPAVTPEADVLTVLADLRAEFPTEKPRALARRARDMVSGWTAGDIYALARRD